MHKKFTSYIFFTISDVNRQHPICQTLSETLQYFVCAAHKLSYEGHREHARASISSQTRAAGRRVSCVVCWQTCRCLHLSRSTRHASRCVGFHSSCVLRFVTPYMRSVPSCGRNASPGSDTLGWGECRRTSGANNKHANAWHMAQADATTERANRAVENNRQRVKREQ